MRKFTAILSLTMLLAGTVLAQSNIQEALDSLTPDELKGHVMYLADDAMKGRNTPSPELDSAAAYIARAFKAAGLEAPNGSYYQPFNLLRSKLGEVNTLSLVQNGAETVFAIKNDFVPLAVTKNGSINNAAVVFAGYGITAPEHGYDDYAGINAQGKVVLIFTGEPQSQDTSSVFDGTRDTDYAKLRVKVENALEHGAAGLLLMSDPHRRFRKPPNFWPSLMRNAPEDAVPLKREQVKGESLLAMQIGKKLAGALEQDKDWAGIYDAIDQDLSPRSFEISGVTISMETNLLSERYPTQNVWAFLEGSDPALKDEVVIVGGHYDHVGVMNGEVYNGADDNASGTSGVIELAEAFAMLDQRPKRSMLFMAYAGEEKGLFGSYHYTDHPLLPIKQTAAMFSLDMISRNPTNEVILIGDECSEGLTANCEEANETVGMEMTKTSKWFLQSDHYPFYKKGVPVLFFNCGDTEDLHQPGDDPEKVDGEKMSRITRLVFLTMLKTANTDARPDYIKFR